MLYVLMLPVVLLIALAAGVAFGVVFMRILSRIVKHSEDQSDSKRYFSTMPIVSCILLSALYGALLPLTAHMAQLPIGIYELAIYALIVSTSVTAIIFSSRKKLYTLSVAFAVSTPVTFIAFIVSLHYLGFGEILPQLVMPP